MSILTTIANKAKDDIVAEVKRLFAELSNIVKSELNIEQELYGNIVFKLDTAIFDVVLSCPLAASENCMVMVSLVAKEKHGHAGTINIRVPQESLDRVSGMIFGIMTESLQTTIHKLHHQYSRQPQG